MRYRELHTPPDKLPTGDLNLITDVPGLAVGHVTVIKDEPTVLRTGVSVLTIEDVLENPVAASCSVFNGYGKSMGLSQVEELGSMESHIFLTNTLSIGAVQQGAVKVARAEKPNIRSFNAMVMECNDGRLNDIASLAVTPEMAIEAHKNAKKEFALGSVGAGTGMVCFGFKGGIGSSSRKVEVDGKEYTVGAMVLSNFGRREDLKVPGVEATLPESDESGDGSLIMIVGTDMPLMPHQLKRLARHAPLAIGILGSPGSHGSGDYALAFSTGTRISKGKGIEQRPVLVNDGAAMSLLFRAAVWASAEAILDSMFTSGPMKGYRKEVESLVQFTQ